MAKSEQGEHRGQVTANEAVDAFWVDGVQQFPAEPRKGTSPSPERLC